MKVRSTDGRNSKREYMLTLTRRKKEGSKKEREKEGTRSWNRRDWHMGDDRITSGGTSWEETVTTRGMTPDHRSKGRQKKMSSK